MSTENGVCLRANEENGKFVFEGRMNKFIELLISVFFLLSFYSGLSCDEILVAGKEYMEK